MVDQLPEDELRSRLADDLDDKPQDVDWGIEQAREYWGDLIESYDPETAIKFTVSKVVGDALHEVRTTNGDNKEIEVLSIGNRGTIDGWGQDNTTVVYGHGLIKQPGEQGAGRAVFVNRMSDGVSPSDAISRFEPFGSFSAVYEVEESDAFNDTYICWSSESTEFKDDAPSLPDDRDKRREIVDARVPETTIANLADNLSGYDPETGYTHDFGVDLKRLGSAVVQDTYRDESKDFGVLTVVDPSVTQDDLEGSDFVEDDARVPGLTVYATANQIEHGRGSIVDLYGVVRTDDNSIIKMDLVAAVPQHSEPLQENESADDSATTKTETTL